MEIGLAAHPPEGEVGLEKLEEPSPGQPCVMARQREAGMLEQPWTGNTVSSRCDGHVLEKLLLLPALA